MSTDPIRLRLDELRWETNCFWIAQDALRSVLDLCDIADDISGRLYTELTREAIAEALGVTDD